MEKDVFKCQGKQQHLINEQVRSYTGHIYHKYKAEVCSSLRLYMLTHKHSSHMSDVDFDPEDIVQEAAYRVYEHLLSSPTFPSHPKAYLLTTAKNIYHNRLRSNSGRSTESLEILTRKRTEDNEYVQEEIWPDPQCSLEEQVLHQSDLAFIHEITESFPAIDKQVLKLIWDGKKYAEIAACLHLDIWKVKKIKEKRMQYIREQLQKEEMEGK